ncbi:hypothetical protein [Dyadobacter sp. CY312]|uniref:hypothetical protein n=1 Tax=Dyadobacter sp. CY312 TaxID=2907303 RepID=UPI001F1EFB3E|nr:hypothetical protein [Dyadobacter sp. CY312]MCE7044628.1 hypothetical protein [Dyadobacter sp. CY312]
MSVELNDPPRSSSTDLGVLAKELDIPPARLYRWRRDFMRNGMAISPAMER